MWFLSCPSAWSSSIYPMDVNRFLTFWSFLSNHLFISPSVHQVHLFISSSTHPFINGWHPSIHPSRLIVTCKSRDRQTCKRRDKESETQRQTDRDIQRLRDRDTERDKDTQKEKTEMGQVARHPWRDLVLDFKRTKKDRQTYTEI